MPTDIVRLWRRGAHQTEHRLCNELFALTCLFMVASEPEWRGYWVERLYDSTIGPLNASEVLGRQPGSSEPVRNEPNSFNSRAKSSKVMGKAHPWCLKSIYILKLTSEPQDWPGEAKTYCCNQVLVTWFARYLNVFQHAN